MEDEVDGGGKHGAFLKKQTAYFNRLEKCRLKFSDGIGYSNSFHVKTANQNSLRFGI
ncbi:hypothetical protein F528_1250 [Neisseria meningitidis 992008]|uniref:Uncharacterized protein n=1 Tax=Neisseria meningitidis alpha275 TaxID=295996 RepID=C6SKD5_NEIME|nr:hypothetical protein F528_1250 [Neisseria meningitidis 992008]CBA08081.1 hypothetical protein predicted by Glimmer/Critica [Neisseria meningitidis alpha275]